MEHFKGGKGFMRTVHYSDYSSQQAVTESGSMYFQAFVSSTQQERREAGTISV